MNFKLFGINFKISFVFTVFLAVFIATDKTGNIIPFLLATFFHELGHLICMALLKATPSEIILELGTIRIVEENIKTKNETLLILLSGPIINLILFLTFINFNSQSLFAIASVLGLPVVLSVAII